MFQCHRAGRLLIRSFLMMSWLLIFNTSAGAQVSVVVSRKANVDSSKINEVDIKRIFSGAQLKWDDGGKIQVIDQSETSVGKVFYKKVLKQSKNQMQRRWARLRFSGKAGALTKVKSDKQVKQIVSRNHYAIGYILTSALDESVKEIFRLKSPNRTIEARKIENHAGK